LYSHLEAVQKALVRDVNLISKEGGLVEHERAFYSVFTV
jgi:hypothetical protein